LLRERIEIGSLSAVAKTRLAEVMSEPRQKVWLERHQTWADLKGAWTGLEVLGVAGFEICGL